MNQTRPVGFRSTCVMQQSHLEDQAHNMFNRLRVGRASIKTVGLTGYVTSYTRLCQPGLWAFITAARSEASAMPKI